MLAGSALFLTACVSEPRYEAPGAGVSLSFVQNITPLRAFSRVTANVSIQRADATGEFVSVGQISGDMLLNTTRLVPDVSHIITAEFDIRNTGVSGRLSDRVTFTPKSGVDYQLVITYLDTDYGIRLVP